MNIKSEINGLLIANKLISNTTIEGWGELINNIKRNNIETGNTNEFLFNNSNGLISSTPFIKINNSDLILEPESNIVINNKIIFFNQDKTISIRNINISTSSNISTSILSINTQLNTSYLITFNLLCKINNSAVSGNLQGSIKINQGLNNTFPSFSSLINYITSLDNDLNSVWINSDASNNIYNLNIIGLTNTDILWKGWITIISI